MQVVLVEIVTMCMIVPLAMSLDPASVLTSCDDLLTELNAQRCEVLDDEERFCMIRRLEEYLNALNNRQGLGFSANGAVLDKKRLRNMMVAVGGVFGTRSCSPCTAPLAWLRRCTS